MKTDIAAAIAVKAVQMSLAFILVVLILGLSAWLDGPSEAEAAVAVELDKQDAINAAPITLNHNPYDRSTSK